MNKNFTVQVKCQDEGTRAKYTALAAQMVNDEDFKSRLNFCKNEEGVYDLYKEKGYTDLSFTDFAEQFRDTLNQLFNVENSGSFELSEDELEDVVGGFDFFKFATAFVSAVPVVGPIIAGTAKAIKAGLEGKGIEEIVKQAAVGVGLAMIDGVVCLATMGTAPLITGTAKIALNVGMAGFKAGLNCCLD